MAYVIAEPCIDVKDRACVEVCPVDCIHPRADEDKGQRMLYIHPDVCIDCGACEPVCPVKAISAESEVPAEWEDYVEMNADYYRVSPEKVAERWGHAP